MDLQEPRGSAGHSRGRESFERYRGADFLAELSRRYRQASKSRQATAEGWSDPRWQTVAHAIDAVPEGGWKSYGDLSTLVGLPARSVGTLIRSHEVPNAHRVLNANGSIAESFQWSDPDRPQGTDTYLRYLRLCPREPYPDARVT